MKYTYIGPCDHIVQLPYRLGVDLRVSCPSCGRTTDGLSWCELSSTGEKPTSEGRKDDSGKNELDLLPVRAIEAMGRVLSYGARKYDRENWRKVPDGRRRYIAACLRHVFAAMRGEKSDPETGESHWAHAMTCLAFIIELEQE